MSMKNNNFTSKCSAEHPRAGQNIQNMMFCPLPFTFYILYFWLCISTSEWVLLMLFAGWNWLSDAKTIFFLLLTEQNNILLFFCIILYILWLKSTQKVILASKNWFWPANGWSWSKRTISCLIIFLGLKFNSPKLELDLLYLGPLYLYSCFDFRHISFVF